MPPENLTRLFDRKARVDEAPANERCYCAFTLTADPKGKLCWSAWSHFVGWHDRKRRWEVRAPSVLNPFAYMWKSIGQPYVFLNSDPGYLFF